MSPFYANKRPLRWLAVFLFFTGLLVAQAPGFKENKGQVTDQSGKANPAVTYLGSSQGTQVQLRKTGFSYALSSARNLPVIQPGRRVDLAMLQKVMVDVHRVDIEFEGMSSQVQITASQPGSDVDNYYLNGREMTGVRSFAKVLYKNVYFQTDIEFLQNSEGIFKYNIILHPGADISQVKFRIRGADRLSLLPDGRLGIHTSLGRLTEAIPASYYEGQPSNTVKAAFKLEGDLIGFSADYDKSRSLVIDPVSNRVWGSYCGGSGIEYCYGTGVDASNNVYICGVTSSSANIATTGAYQSTFGGQFDAYIVKFNTAGVRQWGTYLGGMVGEIFYAIHVESNGTIYAAGDTNSPSGVATTGAHQTVFGGGIDDILLAKFNSSGQRLWSTYIGDVEHDIAQAVTTDNSGNVIVTGHTESTSGIATAGVYSSLYTLNYDVFVNKFTSAGVRLWGTYYGDSGVDEAYGIATDAGDNIYITGSTQSIAGISTPTGHQLGSGGGMDAYLAKFVPTGTAIAWATYYGGSGTDFGNDVEVDANGNVFVAGITTSPNNMATPGAYQTLQGSNDDAFLAAFTSLGTRLWGTYFGGEDTDYIYDLLIDQKKNLLFCGSTLSSYSISTTGAYQPSITTTFFYDAYFAKFSNSGNKILSTYYGGEQNDNARGIAVDGLGKVYLVGETTSTTSIATAAAHSTAHSGSFDAFIAKFCIPFVALTTPAAGTATLCTKATTLSAAPGYSTYLWNSTFTANPLVVGSTTVAGTYTFSLKVDDGYGCEGLSDTIVLVVQKCTDTGIEEQERQAQLRVYPNPTGGNLYIELLTDLKENAEIELLDVCGRSVLKTELKDFSGQEHPLNISHLPMGVYFLQLSQQGRLNGTQKIVKGD